MELGSKIIEARRTKGWTQEALAEATALSLRTVQRLEKGQNNPRAYTLRVLEEVLDWPAGDLSKAPLAPKPAMPPKAWTTLQLINLSALAIVVVPLLHLLFPLIIWHKNKMQQYVDELGRRILSFQILWSLLLVLALALVPILSFLFTGQVAIGKFPTPLVVYGSLVLTNVVFILLFALQLVRGEQNFLLRIPKVL